MILNKINVWKFLTIILAVIIMIFMWTSYGAMNKISDQVLLLDKYKNDSIEFVSTINKLGQEVNTQISLVTVKTKQIQKLLLDSSNLVELNHQIKIKSETKIKNILASYSSGNKDDFDTDIIQPKVFDDFITNDSTGLEYVALGTQFDTKTKWYNLKGTILKEGVSISALNIINDDTYNVGYGKRKLKNLFKSKPLLLEVKHKNPHTRTVTLKNIHLDPPPKKWFQTNSAKIGFGIIGGTILGITIMK